ncbi:sodium:proton antiporter [Candidatus Kaiserbacteria bacterium]|nr:sodium:proton antiporter [Candidatus Kaiserbacteria bacterium]
MLTTESLLAALMMLVIASATFFIAKRVRLPYTALLAFVGMALAPVSLHVPLFSFMRDFVLTPELLFYVFLPTLIFESAYNIDVRRLSRDLPVIASLAIVSLLISTFLIAGALYFVLDLIGFSIPFTLALLFGTLISATDPVAVLALFKEYGAPRRLSLIFEGESLFNDGTAVALFLIVLGVILNGYHGFATIETGVTAFLMMVIGGAFLGLFFGWLFANIIGFTKQNESVSITLTIVMAHLTFLLTDLVAHHLSWNGHPLHLSAIISTSVASIVMGNYGRYKISVRAEAFVEKFWEQLAFISNSIVFILIGLLFAELPTNTNHFWMIILSTIVIVAIARALSIYPVMATLNFFLTEKIPRTWQHLMAWGSLRGALAVTMVLLIPDTLSFPGWEYAITPKEFILTITIGCVFTTLFLKATTIGSLMKKLKIDTLRPLEALQYEEARALVEHTVLERLNKFAKKNYIDTATFEALHKKHGERYMEACTECAEHADLLAESALRLHAIGIERFHLKKLYQYGEVSEKSVKRIMNKLAVQSEYLDEGNMNVPETSTYAEKDLFGKLTGSMKDLLYTPTAEEAAVENYTYYRAQSIIARKVLKELDAIETKGESRVFSLDALEKTRVAYRKFRDGSTAKMEAVAKKYPSLISETNRQLAERGLFKVEETVLDDLFEKEFITPKIYITLRNQFEEEAV